MADKCVCCFEDYIVKCPEEINIFGRLEGLTTYEWVITDKFDKQYTGSFETDGDGFWDIPVADLPPGLLTEFSGTFKLQVYSITDKCKPVKMMIAQEYDCIEFTVQAGTRVKNSLGCQFI